MKLALIVLYLLFTSCEKKLPTKPSLGESEFNSSNSSSKLKKSSEKYNFDEKEKESCDTEEEVEEKLVRPKLEAFKLQGGESGCEI